MPAAPARRAPGPPHPAVDALLQRISAEYGSLSKQLKLIARHVEQYRDHLGLEKIQDVAQRCGVQHSAVVRFAKHFGFSGYSELQRVFRDGLAQQIAPSRNYQARIREVIDQASGRLSSADIASEFIGGAIAGMQELQRDLHGSTLGDAVALLAQAPALWVAGARRSFPVAAYLVYALQHTDKPVQCVTGLGAMQEGQLRSLRAGDVMIATSFAPYAEETLRAACPVGGKLSWRAEAQSSSQVVRTPQSTSRRRCAAMPSASKARERSPSGRNGSSTIEIPLAKIRSPIRSLRKVVPRATAGPLMAPTRCRTMLPATRGSSTTGTA